MSYFQESGLYYLQSRYYNPEVGRFLNADSYVSTGQGLLGNNMFAYCGNNPANHRDPTGTVHRSFSAQINALFYEGSGGIAGLGSSTYGVRNGISAIKDYIFNEEESKVLEAQNVAFYKGVPVVKVAAMDQSAFSFGIIYMGSNVDDGEMLKHEYGHFVHLQLIGWKNYISKVVVPSMFDYWASVPYYHYYSEPQEYVADMLGGVNRMYLDAPYPYNASNSVIVAYLIYSIMP